MVKRGNFQSLVRPNIVNKSVFETFYYYTGNPRNAAQSQSSAIPSIFAVSAPPPGFGFLSNPSYQSSQLNQLSQSNQSKQGVHSKEKKGGKKREYKLSKPYFEDPKWPSLSLGYQKVSNCFGCGWPGLTRDTCPRCLASGVGTAKEDVP